MLVVLFTMYGAGYYDIGRCTVQAPILLKRAQLMLDQYGWDKHFDLHLPNN
jgi:hypothetical protein